MVIQNYSEQISLILSIAKIELNLISKVTNKSIEEIKEIVKSLKE